MPYKPEDLPAGLDVKNAEVRMYHMWAESLVGVASNDLQRHALILAAEPSWPPGACNRRKYVIYNTREGLTRPGQWYLDRTAGRLVYWPLPGEDLAKSLVVAPASERIVGLAGTPQKPVENVTLRSLRSRAPPPRSSPPASARPAFDGAVNVVHARGCAFEDLEISNVGGVGFRAENLAKSRLASCSIHDTGACGANINGGETLIASNHIHHLGVYYPSACASMLAAPNAHLSQRDPDAPYSGIIGGGKECLIEET
jgi:hypothetical protein